MHTKSHTGQQLFVEANPNYSLDRCGKASAPTSNTQSSNYKASTFAFVCNARPAEGAAGRRGNIRKITGFRTSPQRGRGLDRDNRPEHHSQTGRRTKKWKPDKRMMDVKKRLQKGVHANARGEMKTIHKLHDRINLICQNAEGNFSIFLERKDKDGRPACVPVYQHVSQTVYAGCVCVFECVWRNVQVFMGVCLYVCVPGALYSAFVLSPRFAARVDQCLSL